jgi:hypothetical protein
VTKGEPVTRPSWVPEDVDEERPSVARVYDYFLGGSHNFAVDREFAERVLNVMPEVTAVAQENRAFMRRAVRYLCAEGIRQFIDLGSGIPTVGNVHEVAQAVHPDSKVVYVDLDPVAYAHSRAILADNPNATVVRGDLRRPAEVLADPQVRAYIDFDQPVGVLLVSVLHFMSDEDRPADIVAGYASATVPGSHVIVSHACVEGMTEAGDRAVGLYNRNSAAMVVRTTEQVVGLLSGLSIVDPGAVGLARWRPDFADEVNPAEIPGVAVVGRRV